MSPRERVSPRMSSKSRFVTKREESLRQCVYFDALNGSNVTDVFIDEIVGNETFHHGIV